MEQQQCPICMLYLLPGMNLSDHLDTHPKDMIIKALLTSKVPEPPKQQPQQQQIEANPTTVFLAPQQFGHSSQTHIYSDQQQNNFSIAKRPQSHNGGALLLNNRPYRLTIDAPQNIVSTPTTTFLNTNSTGFNTRQTAPLATTTTTTSQSNDGRDIYEAGPSNATGSSSFQQKNIMIVNTSSTQFIQQTLPVKKQTPAAIELHPVFIDNSKMPTIQNPISIIPRYTNEKYSGPPPSYSTAISSVTNTINDKQPRVIDLTQTPTKMSMKNFNNIASTTTLNSNGSEENCHFMITSSTPQQKILEYTQTENGDLMITEKLVPSTSSQSMTIEHEEVVEEVVHCPQNTSSYTIKYVDFDNDIGMDVTNDENQYEEVDKTTTTIEVIDHGKDITAYKTTAGTSKSSSSGVKVLSDVKLTSSEMLSPKIKDIIQQYNDQHQTENAEIEEEEQMEAIKDSESDGDIVKVDNKKEDVQEISEEEDEKVDEEKSAPITKCLETLDLSKESEEETPDLSSKRNHTHEDSITSDDQQPSTSSGCVSSTNVFSSTPLNRLKPVKQPKKLIVKLKKPIATPEISTGECSSSTIERTKADKSENKHENVSIKCEQVSIKVESNPFDTSFLDHHNYDQVSRIEVTPEILHDSETNQSLLSMDLEPETSFKKEKDDFDIVIKTEQNISSSSAISNSQSSSSSSSSSADQMRLNHDTSGDNRSSQLNFLYQNDRVRFSPPLSPFVYLKTFSSSQSEDHSKAEGETSWNGSNSLAIHNLDQNSTSSRYTPSIDDNRSNYTDLDSGNNKTNSSEIGRRAPSADSLNIRTDEKMPARGEISEQESNGEIEQPWHPYFQLQPYPSSYDMNNTAQECWNLSKADSQNACDSNNIQNVIINFPPLNSQNGDIKTPDLLKSIMQTVTKQEPTGIDDEPCGSNSASVERKNRIFRCPECSKVYHKLRARNKHIEQCHPNFQRHKKSKIPPTATQTSKPETSSLFATSSSLIGQWKATSTVTSSQEQEVKVLSIIKSEPSTSAAVLVKNEMNRMLISTTGSIKMEMDRLLLEPSTSTSASHIPTLGLKIKRTYMCAKCNEPFRTLKLLDKHFQIHPAECTLCQKTFNSWNTFSLHLKHHLNIRVHACRFCPKRFVQRQRLVEHERVHTGSMPIKCSNCDERFRRYSNMLHHRARVHLNKKPKQEDFVCDCGEIFPTKAKLEWHQETHENKPKPCPYCRERFTHRNSLTRHIRLSHTDKYEFAQKKAVNCPVCNMTYLPSSIKAHMATHQLASKEYSCSICNKLFSTKWNLKQHHWTHANRSTKPFQCNICPSAFVRETDYTTHMNAHRSIKPFTCNTCGKRFVRKYNWLRHSREHEREKKFVCDICNKKFHRAYYLTEHKRVHTGERPFSCTICGKTSATKTNHNKHIKIHHARDPLTAEG